MLLLISASLAHTPHDVALYVAVDESTGRLGTHIP